MSCNRPPIKKKFFFLLSILFSILLLGEMSVTHAADETKKSGVRCTLKQNVTEPNQSDVPTQSEEGSCYASLEECTKLLGCDAAGSCPTKCACGAADPSCPLAEDTRGLINPLGTLSISSLIGRLIKVITGLSASVALLMFVIGGVMWLTSAGNPEQVKKGRAYFTWAAIGLVVMFTAYAVVSQIFTILSPG